MVLSDFILWRGPIALVFSSILLFIVAARARHDLQIEIFLIHLILGLGTVKQLIHSLKLALLIPHPLTLHSVLANLLLIGCLLSNRRFGQLGGVPVLSARLLLTTFLSQQVPLNTQSAYNLLLQTAIIMYLNQWSTQWNNRLWSSFGVWKNVTVNV